MLPSGIVSPFAIAALFRERKRGVEFGTRSREIVLYLICHPTIGVCRRIFWIEPDRLVEVRYCAVGVAFGSPRNAATEV